MPWARTRGLRLGGWGESPTLTRIYLAGEYSRLLKVVQALRRDYRDEDPEQLALWLLEHNPLPSWLARFRYRPFVRRLLTREPSETTLYILARRHGYRPSTVKRYITWINREADAAVKAARAAEKCSHPKRFS